MFSLFYYAAICAGWCFISSIPYLHIGMENGVNPIRLVLVGIGINAGFSAALAILQLKMNPQDFRQATVWLSGDIWSADWTFVLALLHGS